MNDTYFVNLKDTLEKAYHRAKSKVPRDTMLKLTDKQLEDLYYLWTMRAKDYYNKPIIML